VLDEEFVSNLRIVVSSLLLILTFLRGGAPERVLAGVLMAAALCSGICIRLVHHLSHEDCWIFVAVDIVAFMLMLVVALKANRVYPLWIGAIELVMLISHLWRLSFLQALPHAHTMLHGIAAITQLLVLAVGLAAHMRRDRSQAAAINWIGKMPAS
jgi:hypothetical protein